MFHAPCSVLRSPCFVRSESKLCIWFACHVLKRISMFHHRLLAKPPTSKEYTTPGEKWAAGQLADRCVGEGCGPATAEAEATAADVNGSLRVFSQLQYCYKMLASMKCSLAWQSFGVCVFGWAFNQLLSSLPLSLFPSPVSLFHSAALGSLIKNKQGYGILNGSM